VAAVVVSDRRYLIGAIIGATIGLSLFGLWYFHIEPAYSYLAGVMPPLQLAANSIVGGLKTAAAGIMTAFVTQPFATGTAMLASAGAIYGIVSKIRADKLSADTRAIAAKEVGEAQKAAIVASQQATMATEKIKTLEAQIEEYKNDTSFGDSQKIIAEQRDRVRTLEATVAELERVIEGLKLKEKTVIG
jgi:ribosomal protein S15P/S13E